MNGIDRESVMMNEVSTLDLFTVRFFDPFYLAKTRSMGKLLAFHFHHLSLHFKPAHIIKWRVCLELVKIFTIQIGLDRSQCFFTYSRVFTGYTCEKYIKYAYEEEGKFIRWNQEGKFHRVFTCEANIVYVEEKTTQEREFPKILLLFYHP